MNGFLVWADIQRRTTAENVWKAQALMHFTKEEITEAKEILWDVAPKSIVCRKDNKMTRDIQINISNASTKLAEKEVLLIFIATSNMVMQTLSNNVARRFDLHICRKAQ